MGLFETRRHVFLWSLLFFTLATILIFARFVFEAPHTPRVWLVVQFVWAIAPSLVTMQILKKLERDEQTVSTPTALMKRWFRFAWWLPMFSLAMFSTWMDLSRIGILSWEYLVM